MSNTFRPVGVNPADMTTPFGIFDLMLRQYFGSRLAVMQPVEIVSVNGAFANVRPIIARFDTNGNVINITDKDIIPNIPIVQPFSASGTVRIKVGPGDKGLLFAGNFDTSKYKQAHGRTTVGSARQFNWSDGFFMPVDFQALPDGVLIQSGASEIKAKDGEVSITTTKLKITADVEITGDIKATGDMDITGNIDTTGDITAIGEVTGKEIALSTHMHGVTMATGTGTPPPPATDWPSTPPIPGV